MRLSHLTALLASSAIVAGAAASFVPGDLYLVSDALPDAEGFSKSGVLRVDPLTGASSILVWLPGGTFQPGNFIRAASATYDPARDRILVAQINGSVLGTIDSDGATSTIVTGFTDAIQRMAPTGDGRVYFVNSFKIGYIDGSDVVHDLLDPGGSPALVHPFQANTRSMIYDAGTNSLILAIPVVGNVTALVKVPLNESGSQMLAAATVVEVDLLPGFSEEVRGISAGPGGAIFMAIDVNSNSVQPLLQLVDPVTLGTSTFSLCQYDFSAGQTTGSYSFIVDKGVALDSFNNHLRQWGAGLGGPGMILASNVSGSGSGEEARLLTVGATINGTASIPGDLDGDGDVDGGDLGALLGQWGPCGDCLDCPPDLNGDCIVDAADLGLLLANWGT